MALCVQRHHNFEKAAVYFMGVISEVSTHGESKINWSAYWEKKI